jgi:hypothetical protein
MLFYWGEIHLLVANKIKYLGHGMVVLSPIITYT